MDFNKKLLLTNAKTIQTFKVNTKGLKQTKNWNPIILNNVMWYWFKQEIREFFTARKENQHVLWMTYFEGYNLCKCKVYTLGFLQRIRKQIVLFIVHTGVFLLNLIRFLCKHVWQWMDWIFAKSGSVYSLVQSPLSAMWLQYLLCKNVC